MLSVNMKGNSKDSGTQQISASVGCRAPFLKGLYLSAAVRRQLPDTEKLWTGHMDLI